VTERVIAAQGWNMVEARGFYHLGGDIPAKVCDLFLASLRTAPKVERAASVCCATGNPGYYTYTVATRFGYLHGKI